MEQATQQISQNPSAPIKTKIAAWWIILIEIISLGYWLKLLYWIESSPRYDSIGLTIINNVLFLIFVLLLFLLLLLFVPAYFLLRAKKWAWTVLFILFLIVTVPAVFVLIQILLDRPDYINAVPSIIFKEPTYAEILVDKLSIFSLVFLASFLIPLILLFLDRKNFFKIAS
jgi:magnesium-transporting ATPase (P-type)